jgi:hypothetical protein
VAVPPDAWTFDPTRPQARATVPTDEAAALAGRLSELRAQKADVRTRIAAEPDARNRQPLYVELHHIDAQLSPLERQVAAASPAR